MSKDKVHLKVFCWLVGTINDLDRSRAVSELVVLGKGYL